MRPLLLLHGALGNADQLQPLLLKLSNQFDVHIVEFSGHNTKPFGGYFSIDVFVEDVLDYMKTHEIDKCDIFGYSMGGYVAAKLALIHPQKVNKIMTLGTKWDWDIVSAEKETSMLNPKVIATKVPQYATKLKAIFGETNWEDVMNKTASMMMELGNGKAMSIKELRRIKTPILVCRGSEDKMVSLASSKEVANILPEASYKEFVGWQHPLEKVDIQELVKEIIKYFGAPINEPFA